LRKTGRLQVVGIIQEQHPERARLFMQWKQMKWPVLVDSLNLLGVSAVPITLFLDEQGVIRRVGPKMQELESFLATPEVPGNGSDDANRSGVDLVRPDRDSTARDWLQYADQLFLWGGSDELDRAVQSYETALDKRYEAATLFRLGVALRRRYESNHRRSDDFKSAVQLWAQALELNPNQYIWRRRIQQYGPRLTKPYPFYDWVSVAREEIDSRGELPVDLPVEPAGAEYASPLRDFLPPSEQLSEPDPYGRILRDRKGLIQAEVVTVPAILRPGDSVRVHVSLRPNQSLKAHWNNEVEDLLMWISPAEGWLVDHQLLSVANPPLEVSQETRIMEFELQSPADSAGKETIQAYALYYVCEDVRGACLYRRLDFDFPIQTRDRP
jgi:tetratricopeptide (TPR) repeat protein